MAIYLVNQNQSFEIEEKDGYLWAPHHGKQKLKSGSYNKLSGYELMKQVKKGDYILNYSGQKIKAISVALQEYTDAERPKDKVHSGYASEGYKIEVDYHKLNPEIEKEVINAYALRHPEENTCFRKNGDIKMGGYLFSLTKNNADYILNKILEKQQDDDVIKILKDAIKQNEKSSSGTIKNDDESEIVFSKIYGPGKVEKRTPCGDGWENVHVEFFECVGNKKYIFQMPDNQDKNSPHIPINDIDNKE